MFANMHFKCILLLFSQHNYTEALIKTVLSVILNNKHNIIILVHNLIAIYEMEGLFVMKSRSCNAPTAILRCMVSL